MDIIFRDDYILDRPAIFRGNRWNQAPRRFVRRLELRLLGVVMHSRTYQFFSDVSSLFSVAPLSVLLTLVKERYFEGGTLLPASMAPIKWRLLLCPTSLMRLNMPLPFHAQQDIDVLDGWDWFHSSGADFSSLILCAINLSHKFDTMFLSRVCFRVHSLKVGYSHPLVGAVFVLHQHLFLIHYAHISSHDSTVGNFALHRDYEMISWCPSTPDTDITPCINVGVRNF